MLRTGETWIHGAYQRGSRQAWYLLTREGSDVYFCRRNDQRKNRPDDHCRRKERYQERHPLVEVLNNNTQRSRKLLSSRQWTVGAVEAEGINENFLGRQDPLAPIPYEEADVGLLTLTRIVEQDFASPADWVYDLRQAPPTIHSAGIHLGKFALQIAIGQGNETRNIQAEREPCPILSALIREMGINFNVSSKILLAPVSDRIMIPLLQCWRRIFYRLQAEAATKAQASPIQLENIVIVPRMNQHTLAITDIQVVAPGEHQGIYPVSTIAEYIRGLKTGQTISSSPPPDNNAA